MPGLYGRVCSILGVLPLISTVPDVACDVLGWFDADLAAGPGGSSAAGGNPWLSSACQAAAEASA